MSNPCPGLAAALVAGAALLATEPVSAAVFTSTARACNVAGASNSSTPTSGADSCSVAFGSFGAQAFATFGSVGASATAETLGASFQGGNAESFASFQDIIQLQRLDPSGPDVIPVSFNLTFSGLLQAETGNPFSGGAAGYQFALVSNAGSFRGIGNLHTSFGLDVRPSGLGDDAGNVREGAFSVDLVTPTFLVDFTGRTFAPVEIAFSVNAAAGASGVGSGAADFSHTLEFASGPVFNLPAGFTANAGGYLVDNRFIGPNAAAIPEPASWALMIGGFGLAGAMLRTRRRVAA